MKKALRLAQCIVTTGPGPTGNRLDDYIGGHFRYLKRQMAAQVIGFAGRLDQGGAQ